MNEISQLVIFLSILVVVTAATEYGYRSGLRSRAAAAESGDGNADATRDHVSSLQNGLLGLLALLLGFTFAMAVQRFDARKSLVLEEANAIGTAYLRAQQLREPHRGALSAALREYVDVRLAFAEARDESGAVARANERAAKLHAAMWAVATALAAETPPPPTLILMTGALNDVIDLHEKRQRALEDHVPLMVLLMLLAVAVASMGLIGAHAGLCGRRHAGATVLVAVMVTGVLSVIIDLDRPRRGLVQVSQSSMERLQQSLAAGAPPAAPANQEKQKP
jgi:hypothetical protein